MCRSRSKQIESGILSQLQQTKTVREGRCQASDSIGRFSQWKANPFNVFREPREDNLAEGMTHRRHLLLDLFASALLCFLFLTFSPQFRREVEQVHEYRPQRHQDLRGLHCAASTAADSCSFAAGRR